MCHASYAQPSSKARRTACVPVPQRYSLDELKRAVLTTPALLVVAPYLALCNLAYRYFPKHTIRPPSAAIVRPPS